MNEPRPIQSSKTVIFVGGTSYSGSTLIDMILANDPAGVSCGEVYALFYPFRKHHLRLDELGEAIDWGAMRQSGPRNLYANLFNQFPDCRFIVDSSKSPLWISERSKELHADGIRTMNILIWKTPDEFLASRRKRGQERGWQREWINYHRYYFTLIRNWRSVRYRDLVMNKDVLPRLCSFLGISYFPDKEQYWKRAQHAVFGNDTTKIHLFDESTDQFAKVKSAIAFDIPQTEPSMHRTISYSPIDGPTRAYDAGMFNTVREILECFDVSADASQRDRLQARAQTIRTNWLYHCVQAAKLKSGLGWIVDAVRR